MASPDSAVEFGSADIWWRAGRLIVDAIRRRWISVAAITLLFLTVGGAAATWLPRTYSAETRLLIRKNYVMPALAHPKRAVPIGSEAPAQSAAEFVINRDALEGMVRANDLLARWDRERSLLARLKDRVMEWLKGPLADEDKVDALVELLAKRVSVAVQDEVMTIKATWADPVTVRDIVNSAVETFLQARRTIDVQSVTDTHAILARTVELARTQVESQLGDATAAERTARAWRAPAPARAPSAIPAAPPSKPAGLADAQPRWIAARQAREDLERAQQEKTADLEAQLAERRTTQTDRHPDVIALKRALDRLREEPGELQAARQAEARAAAEYEALGGRVDAAADTGAGIVTTASVAPTPAELPPSGTTGEDQALAYQRERLKASLGAYQDLAARLNDVQIELETAKAAFAYRYSVTAPARVPKKADAPNVPLIIIGAMLAGLMAGITRAIFTELRMRALLSPTALGRHLGILPTGLPA